MSPNWGKEKRDMLANQAPGLLLRGGLGSRARYFFVLPTDELSGSRRLLPKIGTKTRVVVLCIYMCKLIEDFPSSKTLSWVVIGRRSLFPEKSTVGS